MDKFGLVTFWRSYNGINQPTTTKVHIYRQEGAERKTLCRWPFNFMGSNPKVAKSIKADIDEYWMLQPENVCKTCYGEFLVQTDRWVEQVLELEGDCGCKLIMRQVLSGKQYRVVYCDYHSAIGEV